MQRKKVECPSCARFIAVRKDGQLYTHDYRAPGRIPEVCQGGFVPLWMNKHLHERYQKLL